jgi:gliding motility-associated-like protein
MEDEDGRTINTCSGTFFDSGGANDDYSNREDLEVTFCADVDGSSIRLTFSELELEGRDFLRFYDGQSSDSPLLEEVSERDNDILPFAISATRENTSGCLTVTFRSRRLIVRSEGAGWAAAISCISRCKNINVEVVRTLPSVMPSDTGWINACIGQEISFEGIGQYVTQGQAPTDGNFTYFWDLGDGTRKEGRTVTHTYAQPGGYIVQLAAIDELSCVSINTIDQRVRISPPPEFSVRDMESMCLGDSISLTAGINGADTSAFLQVNSVETTFEPRYLRSDSLFLPDGKGVAYTTSLNINQFNSGQTLDDVEDLLGICINIEHSYMRDLQVSIECPNGTEVLLQKFETKNRVGSVFLGEPIDQEADLSPGLGYDYCWTPIATNEDWLTYDLNNNIRTLPAGDYQSFESLDSLIGCPLNGDWTITVEDYLLQDNGYIFDWSISFNPDLYPPLETFSAAIVDFSWENQADGVAYLNSAGENPYTFSITDEYGCTYDTTIALIALPPTHPDCYSCQELITQTEDLTYCEEDVPTLNIGVSNNDQAIRFQAAPYFDELNAASAPIGRPYESTVDVNNIFPNTLTDVATLSSVCINLTSESSNPLADLTFTLEAPNGGRVVLVSNIGGNSTNFVQTCFSPTATATMGGAVAPFTGTFQAEGDWNNLIGTDVNGDWTLLVTDQTRNASSTLESWSIELVAENDVTYSWTPSSGLSCDDCPNPSFDNNDAVFQTYMVAAEDQYGCTANDTINVTNISNLNAPSITCESGDNKTLVVDWEEQNGIDYEIQINGSNWFAPNTNIEHAVNGLRNEESVSIQLRPVIDGVPMICNLPVSDTVCIYDGCELELFLTNADLMLSCFDREDGMVQFDWTGGFEPFSYQLNSELLQATDSTYRVDDLAAGEYLFTLMDNEACADTIQFAVQAPDSLNLVATAENPSCSGDQNGQITVEATGGTNTFQYSLDGILFNSLNAFTNLSSGNYEIVVRDENGCEIQTPIELMDPATVEVRIQRDKDDFIQLIYGDEFQLNALVENAQGGVTYEWRAMNGDSSLTCNNCPDPTITPFITGMYEVEVTDANGCTSEDRIQVRVERIFKHFVPEAFSPNEDGINERLTVYTEWTAVVRNFQVFDRWGSLIFSANDFSPNDEMAGWDGRRNGNLVPPGVYVWHSEVEYNDGTRKVFSGSTALVQ